MPKNTETHHARIGKVKEGLGLAKLTADEINRVLGVFDFLGLAEAKELADRTEFDVSSSSKLSEKLFGADNGRQRREMARAILFVADLQAFYDEKPLLTKKTDAEFEAMWRDTEESLRTNLSKFAKALCKRDVDFRAELNRVPPERPKIVIPKTTVPAEITLLEKREALLTSMLKSHQVRITEAKDGITPLAVARTDWSNAKTRLLSAHTKHITHVLSNVDSMRTATAGAYEEHKAFFDSVGKETEAKLEIAKLLFNALSDYAPFPLSVVGKIGAAAVGQLTVDTIIPQTRELEPPKYYNSAVPVLARASAKLAAVKNWKDDITTLGVLGHDLSSITSLGDALDKIKIVTINLMEKVFEDMVKDIYGDTPTEMNTKSADFYQTVMALYTDASRNLSVNNKAKTHIVSQKVTKLSDFTISEIEKVGKMNLVDSKTLQPFIELQLFAEYLAHRVPDTTEQNYEVDISDKLISRLESKPFELILRKGGSNQTSGIYAQKKLPWQDGHPRHVGALCIFFRWYRSHVNPFDIATGKTTAAGVRDTMEKTIVDIGKAIQAHTIRRTFSTTNQADWDKVSAQLSP
jgi:hypothetical protein